MFCSCHKDPCNGRRVQVFEYGYVFSDLCAAQTCISRTGRAWCKILHLQSFSQDCCLQGTVNFQSIMGKFNVYTIKWLTLNSCRLTVDSLLESRRNKNNQLWVEIVHRISTCSEHSTHCIKLKHESCIPELSAIWFYY